MRHTIINPPELVRPRGYSHAVLAQGGRLLFLGGQDATDPSGKLVGPGDVVAQFDQVLRNVQAVLHAAGGEMHHVVQLTVFVRDREEYLRQRKALGEVFRRYFGGYYPAMALFEVSGFFHEGALVEVQGVAVLP